MKMVEKKSLDSFSLPERSYIVEDGYIEIKILNKSVTLSNENVTIYKVADSTGQYPCVSFSKQKSDQILMGHCYKLSKFQIRREYIGRGSPKKNPETFEIAIMNEVCIHIKTTKFAIVLQIMVHNIPLPNDKSSLEKLRDP